MNNFDQNIRNWSYSTVSIFINFLLLKLNVNNVILSLIWTFCIFTDVQLTNKIGYMVMM